MLHAKEAALMTSQPVMVDPKLLLADCERAISSAIKNNESILGLKGVLTNKATQLDVSMWKDTAVLEAMEILQTKYTYKCIVRATDTTPSSLVISWEHI